MSRLYPFRDRMEFCRGTGVSFTECHKQHSVRPSLIWCTTTLRDLAAVRAGDDRSRFMSLDATSPHRPHRLLLHPNILRHRLPNLSPAW
jgi:hypothetical protein